MDLAPHVTTNERIIYLSILFFIGYFRIELKSYTYITYIYLFPFFDMIGKRPHKSEYISPSCVTFGYMVTQNDMLVLIFSPRSVSGIVFLVDDAPCRFMWRCTIVLLMDFNKCLLIKLSVRPGYVLRKTCLMTLRRFVFVGLNSSS